MPKDTFFNLADEKRKKIINEALKEFEEAQLIEISDERIKVSQTGTMLIRNICMPFDAYLNKIPEDKRRFSKTI